MCHGKGPKKNQITKSLDIYAAIHPEGVFFMKIKSERSEVGEGEEELSSGELNDNRYVYLIYICYLIRYLVANKLPQFAK